MGRVVDVADVAVDLVVRDGPMPPGLAHLLEQLPSAAAPPAVRVRHSLVGPPVPDRPADMALGRLEAWIDAPDVRLRDVTGATAELTGHSAEVGGGGAQAANGFHALFLFALTHLLAHHDRFVLHGAAVVRDGAALVVLGGSGEGKSTLAVGAMEAGWGLVADDMVVIRPTASGVDVAGVPRIVLVPAEEGWTVPTRPHDLDARGRVLVPAELQQGWFPVCGTVSVGRSASPDGSVRALEGQERFQRIVGSYVSAVNPPLLRRFLPAAAALSRLPGWDLHHGCDPETRRAVAVGMLSSLGGVTP